MYLEFLKGLVAWVEALDAAALLLQKADEQLSPYVNFVPVLLEGELCGFLNDEIGGKYSYVEATETERIWWDARPGSSDGRG